jgi:hypothetical protein
LRGAVRIQQKARKSLSRAYEVSCRVRARELPGRSPSRTGDPLHPKDTASRIREIGSPAPVHLGMWDTRGRDRIRRTTHGFRPGRGERAQLHKGSRSRVAVVTYTTRNSGVSLHRVRRFTQLRATSNQTTLPPLTETLPQSVASASTRASPRPDVDVSLVSRGRTASGRASVTST